MNSGFIVTLNNQIIYRHQATRSPARLRRHLDEIERQLCQGIELGEQWIEQPSDFQILQYVAMYLIHSLDKNEQNSVHLMSAYLSEKSTSLVEICVTQEGDQFNLQLKMNKAND